MKPLPKTTPSQGVTGGTGGKEGGAGGCNKNDEFVVDEDKEDSSGGCGCGEVLQSLSASKFVSFVVVVELVVDVDVGSRVTTAEGEGIE